MRWRIRRESGEYYAGMTARSRPQWTRDPGQAAVFQDYASAINRARAVTRGANPAVLEAVAEPADWDWQSTAVPFESIETEMVRLSHEERCGHG